MAKQPSPAAAVGSASGDSLLSRRKSRLLTIRASEDGSPSPAASPSRSSMAASADPSSSSMTGGGAGMTEEMRRLQDDLRRRQTRYARKEAEYEREIDELKTKLRMRSATKSEASAEFPHMDEIKRLHARIMENVEHVHGSTAKIMAEQEKDLLRAFRARLFDVQSELEREKNRMDDGALTWIEKTRQLQKEVDYAKEMADRLDKRNQALTRENNRLSAQFKTQEDDREFMLKQLVAVKKDNTRLKEEMKRLKEMNAALERSKARPVAREAPSRKPSRTPLARGVVPGENEQRYRDMVKRMKKVLDAERQQTRHLRTQLALEMQQRTDLELLLRECVEDVRHQLAVERRAAFDAHRSPSAKSRRSAGSSAAGFAALAAERPSLEDFGAKERERVLEMLLSKERVIMLLYGKTFPPKHSGSGGGGEPALATWQRPRRTSSKSTGDLRRPRTSGSGRVPRGERRPESAAAASARTPSARTASARSTGSAPAGGRAGTPVSSARGAGRGGDSSGAGVVVEELRRPRTSGGMSAMSAGADSLPALLEGHSKPIAFSRPASSG
eukprot:PLAT11010.1.p1 GENE.PLAT11010.1~~PLAT11010.1.p1  ORF type:complete len:585 (-),score=173.66 PLAT11010.1:94-1767(-)